MICQKEEIVYSINLLFVRHKTKFTSHLNPINILIVPSFLKDMSN